jgi:uncharacterized protein YbjT (DUF2867 family)
MKILVFGATGTAGGGVLRACLDAADVDEVRTIARRGPAVQHTKLRSYIHSDFMNYDAVSSAFENVDALLYCLGISATQVPDEQSYRRITRDFAVAAAGMLQQTSPNAAFHYLSGMGADVRSRQMWARVKAEAERDLIAQCGAVCWRPGYIDGNVSESAPVFQKFLKPVFRLAKPFRDLYITAEDLGRAMLQATRAGTRSVIFKNRQIREMA